MKNKEVAHQIVKRLSPIILRKQGYVDFRITSETWQEILDYAYGKGKLEAK